MQMVCVNVMCQGGNQLIKYELSARLLSEWKHDKNGCCDLDVNIATQYLLISH